MVFVGGPRQVGKTTLALSFLRPSTTDNSAFLSWGDATVRPDLVRGILPRNKHLIVLDEIHKYSRWRNLVKGLYDTRSDEVSFLITGSARLDHYRRGGDSLQGRYHYYRLHPFSLCEVNSQPTRADVDMLMQFGGFPEPLLSNSTTVWVRWHRERNSRVVYEDLRDLENVRQVDLVEVLLEALPERVGSPLSVRNLREDLLVAHETVERWITILENLYACFRISPFKSPSIRAVKKEKKLYLWDWSQVPDKGSRFENMVACQLLKYCHYIEDTEGFRMDLQFIRDTDLREVEFVVLRNREPLFAVECKTGERGLNPAFNYFKQRTTIPKFYQVHLGTKDYVINGHRVLPFHTFCRELQLP